MHADVDERTEGGDVGHRPLQDHAALEVLDSLDTLFQRRHLEGWTRIAAGFFQLAQDIGHGGQAERLVHESLRLQLAYNLGIAEQRLDVASGRIKNPPDYRIGFRVHAGGIERVGTAVDAEEPGALLERLRAEPRHILQGLARLERAIGVAVLHDALRKARADA